MKNRNELCKYLRREMEQVIGKDKVIKSYLKQLTEKYEIPSSEIFNIVTLRQDLEISRDEYLYCLCEIIKPTVIPTYFTDVEQRKYKDWKYPAKTKVIQSFRMMQVDQNQWIGSIKASELMALSDKQLLYYNERTQRPLQHVEHGEVQYWRPYVNRSALAAIEKSFREGTYIPNTITLNIPDAIPDYDEDTMTLNIEGIDHFDILDGYHRYRAMVALHNEDPSWDYQMELRIVAFEESKAQFFIYQEDQKTKMNRVASDSMNMNSPQNILVSRMNDDRKFDFGGKINNNDGIINAGELAIVIGKLWFDKASTVKGADLRKIQNEIKEGLTEIANSDETKLDTKWDKQYLYSVMYCIHDGTPVDHLSERAAAVYEKVIRTKLFRNMIIAKDDTNKINKILKGVR